MPEALRISRLELNEQDPNATWFNLHVSRPMNTLEKEALCGLLTKAGFNAPSAQATPTVILVRNVDISAFEFRKDDIKRWASEAEDTAKLQQEHIDAKEAAAVAKFEDAKARAAAMDWT